MTLGEQIRKPVDSDGPGRQGVARTSAPGRRLRAVAICLALAGAQPAAIAAEWRVANSEALAGALRAARPGDRLLLAPGRYGDLKIADRHFSPAIEIRAANPHAPPQWRSLEIADSSGIRLTDLQIVYGPAERPQTTRAAELLRVRDIEFEGMLFAGAADSDPANDPIGAFIRDSTDVSIRRSRFQDLYRGAAILDSSDWSIETSQFQRMSSDGIVARGAVSARIADNRFSDFSTDLSTGVHPDAIQFWDRGARRSTRDLAIRGNVILRRHGGPSQGIFINGENPALASRNIIIENNIIHQSMLQGILVKNVDGAIIRANTVASFDPTRDAPGIEARRPFANVLVERNLAASLRLADAAAGGGNLLLDYDNPWAASYAEKLLANPRAGVEAGPADFVSLAGSGARPEADIAETGPRRVRAFPKTVIDMAIENGRVGDRSLEPIAHARAGGLLTFGPSPRLTGMPRLEILVRAQIDRRSAERLRQTPRRWEHLFAAPSAYEARISGRGLVFSIRTDSGERAQLLVPIERIQGARDITLAYDGREGVISVRGGDVVLGSAVAPKGFIAYRKTGRLHVGGAPWGEPFSGRIERLSLAAG